MSCSFHCYNQIFDKSNLREEGSQLQGCSQSWRGRHGWWQETGKCQEHEAAVHGVPILRKQNNKDNKWDQAMTYPKCLLPPQVAHFLQQGSTSRRLCNFPQQHGLLRIACANTGASGDALRSNYKATEKWWISIHPTVREFREIKMSFLMAGIPVEQNIKMLMVCPL